MSVKFHIHVPNLREFALDAACDDVVRHGKQGLSRPIPYVLYLLCIQTFTEKHRSILTVIKLFNTLRSSSSRECDVSLLYCFMLKETVVVVLDHAYLSIGNTDILSSLMSSLMNYSYGDADRVVECLNRFASRCTRDVVVMAMSLALSWCPCRAVRNVLIRYGGVLDRNDTEYYIMRACANGMVDVISDALKHGYVIKRSHLGDALRSGDLNTIKLVSNCCKQSERVAPKTLDMHDYDVETCDALMPMGILCSKQKYKLNGAMSVDVVQWFVNHDMLDVNNTIVSAAENAAFHGYSFTDVLQYLTAHFTLPKGILSRIYVQHVSNLTAYDDLMRAGADVTYSIAVHVVTKTPLLIRYWMDIGVFVPSTNSVGWNIMKSCIDSRISPQALEIVLDLCGIDVNVHDDDDGTTALHYACRSQQHDIVQVISRRCPDVVTW